MAQAIVQKIDHDPERAGLVSARALCQRWFQQNPQPAVVEWLKILKRPWREIRAIGKNFAVCQWLAA